MDKETKALLYKIYGTLASKPNLSYKDRLDLMVEIFTVLGRGGEQLECLYKDDKLPYLGREIIE